MGDTLSLTGVPSLVRREGRISPRAGCPAGASARAQPGANAGMKKLTFDRTRLIETRHAQTANHTTGSRFRQRTFCSACANGSSYVFRDGKAAGNKLSHTDDTGGFASLRFYLNPSSLEPLPPRGRGSDLFTHHASRFRLLGRRLGLLLFGWIRLADFSHETSGDKALIIVRQADK